VREISENDLRWFAARLSIAIEDIKRLGGMSVHELKQYLRDVPGAESLTMGYATSGNLLVTIAGRTVEVSPTASNADIAQAFATTTPLPPAVTYSIRTEPMSIPAAPGSFAASLKAMMDEARAGIAQARTDGAAKVSDAVSKLNDAKVATTHVAGTIAKTIEDEAADVLRELGQISNDLGGTST
jgi:hypothetical protein